MSQNELDQNAMGGTELVGLGLESRLSQEILDRVQIIRTRVRELDPNKKHVYWIHDLPADPEVQHLRDPASRARFDKIVFVSHWQQQQFHDHLGVPFSDGIVINNAITPIMPNQGDPTTELRLIYHPTPHRGLNILLPAFDALLKHHPQAKLHVYSSFNLYGWGSRDAPYEALFEHCRQHPRIEYFGSKPNDVIRRAVSEAHIFAYPSTWMETSCLCAIEALSARAAVVCPRYGALPETTGGYCVGYDWTENVQDHVDRFFERLLSAADATTSLWLSGMTNPTLRWGSERVNALYSWDTVIRQWEDMLTKLIHT